MKASFTYSLLQLVFLLSTICFTSVSVAQSLEETANGLAGAKLTDVPKIVEQMGTIDDERVLPLFEALLKNRLYYQKSDKRLVYIKKLSGGMMETRGVFDDQPVAQVKKKSLRKVKSNNRLRSTLRSKISSLTLFSSKVEIRKNAVKQLISDLNKDNLAALNTAKEKEQNPEVLDLINAALALSKLKSKDKKTRLASVKLLDGNLQPEVLNGLNALLKTEKNQEVINATEQSIESIKSKKTFYGYIEKLFFGLSLGSVLLLAAAGLAITFGVMGVINMAHGEMIMLGAYTTYVVQLIMPNHLALSILISIPAAFLVAAIFGILIERGVIQFLKGRPLETLLATFGISLILQQLVRTVFSPLNRQVATPEFMSGSLQINPIFSITYNRIYILIFALVVFFILQLILKKTSLGLNVRAVSQNRNMAKCMGIKTERVDMMTFALGSGIAGLAGVALSQITNVGPNLGQSYIIDSFMVVVFGGVGNLWGTLVAAFSLGTLNKFLEPATGAVLANIIVLVGIILFIQKRPKGLFPQKGRAAE